MLTDEEFDQAMAEAAAHGALVHMSTDAAEEGDYDTSFLAWLLTGSHEWEAGDTE